MTGMRTHQELFLGAAYLIKAASIQQGLKRTSAAYCSLHITCHLNFVCTAKRCKVSGWHTRPIVSSLAQLLGVNAKLQMLTLPRDQMGPSMKAVSMKASKSGRSWHKAMRLSTTLKEGEM